MPNVTLSSPASFFETVAPSSVFGPGRGLTPMDESQLLYSGRNRTVKIDAKIRPRESSIAQEKPK
jgi:hypothetical protein